MNTRWWLAAGLVVLLFGWPGVATAQGKPFVWKEGKLEVRFPGEPTVMKDRLQLTQNGGKILYLVITVPIARLEKFPVEQQKVIFDLTRDSLVKSLKGKLLSEKQVKIDKLSGREYRIETPEKTIYRMDTILVDNRMIQLILLATKDVQMSKDAETFFKSFKLVK